MKIKVDTLFLLIISITIILFCLPLLNNIKHISSNDEWVSAFTFNHFSRMSILKYHQIPLWSPFCGGGFPIIGCTYLGFLNPLFILVLIFGEVIGLKLMVLLIYLAAGTGMYYLTRFVFHYHPLAAFFSTLVFTLSGYLPSLLNDGNYFHVYIYLLPWALAFYLNAVQTNKAIKCVTLSALLLSLILLQSGFFFVVASGLLFLFAISSTVKVDFKKRRLKINLRYIKIFLIIILLVISFSAVKILPIINLIKSRAGPAHSIYEDDYETISKIAIKMGSVLNWQRLYTCLFKRHSTEALPTYYMGFIPVIFALLAFIVKPKDNIKWYFIFSIFLFLSMGPLVPIDLFKCLWSLHPYVHFIFKHNKYFSIGIVFSIAVLSGSFLSYLLAKRLRKPAKYVIILFLSVVSVLTLFDLFTSNIFFHKAIFTLPIPVLKQEKDFSQVFIKDMPNRDSVGMHAYSYLVRNTGLINWHNNILLKEASTPKYYTTISNWEDFSKMEINPAYSGEFYFLTYNNKVKCNYFSPIKIILNVDVKSPGTLVINQNYNSSWRTTTGKIKDSAGLLSVRLDKLGTYKIVLRYVPFDFWLGFSLSLMSFLCLGIIIKKYGIKR